MKLPSFRVLASKAAEALRLFPFAILSAVAATALAIYLNETQHIDQSHQLLRLNFVIALGIPLFIAATMFNHRKHIKGIKSFLINVLVIGLLAVIFLTFRNIEADYIRFVLFFIAAFLLASFSFYIGIRNETGFWQYNKTFFLKILISGLYSAVLFGGLSFALLALEKLFDIQWYKLNINIYPDLWLFLAGIFNTWFFLAGISVNPDDYDRRTDYPKGLKVFTQFVLIPIALIYLVILYAYEIRILVQWQLPNGWVSALVITYAAVGVLALLLVYPLREQEGSRWIKIYSRWFFITLFPLLILMYFAVTRRISDYGITENRYFLIVLLIWLFCITLYYSIKGFSKIKPIPVSLAIVAILASIGPWSAFSISENSQIDRLMGMLRKHNVIVNGKISTASASIKKDGQNIQSILHYLKATHGFDGLKEILAAETDADKALNKDTLLVTDFYSVLKLNSKMLEDEGQIDKYRTYYMSESKKFSQDITNSSVFINYEYSGYDSDYTYVSGNTKVKVSMADEDPISMLLVINDIDRIKFNIRDIGEKLWAENKENNSLTLDQATFDSGNENYYVRIIIQDISIASRPDNSENLQNLECMIFIKKK